MNECQLCRKNEESLSLLSANHKERGELWICKECWAELYEKNRMVSGTGEGGCGGMCSSCR